MWRTGLKNSPTVAHVCHKRRLKWVPSAWGKKKYIKNPEFSASTVTFIGSRVVLKVKLAGPAKLVSIEQESRKQAKGGKRMGKWSMDLMEFCVYKLSRLQDKFV